MALIVTGAILNVLHMLTHIILKTTLTGRYYS